MKININSLWLLYQILHNGLFCVNASKVLCVTVCAHACITNYIIANYVVRSKGEQQQYYDGIFWGGALLH